MIAHEQLNLWLFHSSCKANNAKMVNKQKGIFISSENEASEASESMITNRAYTSSVHVTRTRFAIVYLTG